MSSSTNVIEYSDGTVSEALAAKLHGLPHLPIDDMVYLCKKDGVLTPVLRQALQNAYKKYAPSLTTAGPLRSRKVSLRRLLASFNNHIQIDFVFLRALTRMPTEHIVDSKSGLSVAKVVTSRELDEAVRIVETECFNVYGPPLTVSTDPEFAKDPFLPFLKHYKVKFEPRPARRQIRIGIVELKTNILRTLTRRVVKDADNFKTTRGTIAIQS